MTRTPRAFGSRGLPGLVLGLAVSCQTPSGTGSRTAPTVTYTQQGRWAPEAPEAEPYAMVLDAARRAGGSLEPERALAATARELFRRVDSDPARRTPATDVVQALAWLSGVTDPTPTVLVLRGELREARAELDQAFGELVPADRPTHVGVAVGGAPGRPLAVLVLTTRRLTLDPVPRRVRQGERLVLRGRLLEGVRAPALAVTRPDGRAEETPLGDGPDFFGQLPLDARGAWQVELTAESDRGATVVANFPVYVDTDPPATPEDTAAREAEAPESVETALLGMINAARRRAGVSPLEPLAALQACARAHALDMAEHRFVGHVSPTQGTTGQRLERAGLRSGLALENVGRGYTARLLHDGFMASPGHRLNVLHPAVTHVGIGVVREPGVGGGLLVTCDFIQVTPTIDTAAAVVTLLEGINTARRSRGIPPLEARSALQALAQEAARGYFEPPLRDEQAILNALGTRLRSESLLYSRVSLAAGQGASLDEMTRLEPLLDRAMRVVGVGVAQGDRAGSAPNTLFVVYALAVPR
ncbi:MAG: CAP domain-containing protein [Deltaproteobacteria bacterium]|nr:CAP domain-containing protein [Deltaproteobacteria bacterium]